ncbi:MAG: AhpC/TSA family protein [Rhodospirillales bacterium]|nr:AhpC/TSA family protein [Rhodospirillales bacterium]MDE2199809.1 AhpC/TSA family protein [Rhodospirillales bacterium]MDE2575404.1 AhpC/TSA family protein [Rhodospirillales bacterium]
MDSLASQLEMFLDALLERVDPKTAALLQRTHAELLAHDYPHHAVGEGQIAPDFTLPDQHGRPVSLHEALARGPVVLTFFRGGWCPFCSIALRALNRVLPKLRRQGASLLAISPQTPDQSLSTAERNALCFPVLSDAGNAVARRYGLVWKLDADYRALYERLGHDLPRINGTPGWELPVAAGYVIDTDGRVALARVDPRVHRRLEPEEALEAVLRLHARHAEPTE